MKKDAGSVIASLNAIWRKSDPTDSHDSIYGSSLTETISQVQTGSQTERGRVEQQIRDRHLTRRAEDIVRHLIDSTELPGAAIKYVSPLDSGGFGYAFRVRVEPAGDYVLKLLNPEKYTDQNIERFRQEAALLSRVGFDATVPVYKADTYKKQHYILMGYGGRPLYDGRPARDSRPADCTNLDHIRETTRNFLAFVGETVRALRACHQMNIVHRDLKPSNIVIGADDFRRVRLIDFGAARKTDGGDDRITETDDRPPRTKRYCDDQAAPDHYADERYDVYSLGRVIQMVLRCHPVDEENAPGGPLGSDFEPVLPELRRLLEAAVAPDITTRPTAAQLLEDVRAVCDRSRTTPVPDPTPPAVGPERGGAGRSGESAATPPPVPASPFRRLSAAVRHRPVLLALGLAAAVLAGLLTAALWDRSRLGRETHDLRISGLRSEGVVLAFHDRTGRAAEARAAGQRLATLLGGVDPSRLTPAEKLVVAEAHLLLAISVHSDDPPRAGREYGRCVDLLRPLYDARGYKGPDLNQCRETLGRAYGCRGDLALKDEEFGTAGDDYRESSKFRQEVADVVKTPHALIQLARSRGNLARLAHAQGEKAQARMRWKEALTHLDNSIEELRRRPDDPSHAVHPLEGDLVVVAKHDYAYSVLDHQDGFATCSSGQDDEVRVRGAVKTAAQFVEDIQNSPAYQDNIRDLKLCLLLAPNRPPQAAALAGFAEPGVLEAEVKRLESPGSTKWRRGLLEKVKARPQ